jgi:hypothetical protein
MQRATHVSLCVLYGALVSTLPLSLIKDTYFIFSREPRRQTWNGFLRLVDDSILQASVKLHFPINSLLRSEQAANLKDPKSKFSNLLKFSIEN